MNKLFERALFPGETVIGEEVGVWRQDDGSNHFGWVAKSNQNRLIFVDEEDHPAGIVYARLSDEPRIVAIDDQQAELVLNSSVRLRGNAIELGELLEASG